MTTTLELTVGDVDLMIRKRDGWICWSGDWGTPMQKLETAGYVEWRWAGQGIWRQAEAYLSPALLAEL